MIASIVVIKEEEAPIAETPIEPEVVGKDNKEE